MDAYVKNFSEFRTIAHVTALSNSLILDSLEEETSIIDVLGTEIGPENAGDWLLVNGDLYLISHVKPGSNRTVLTVKSPLSLFSRPIEYAAPGEDQTVGGFAASLIQDLWIGCQDPYYAVKYMTVSNSDTTPFSAPELDGNGCFRLAEYLRLMRRSYYVTVQFSVTCEGITCSIRKMPPATRQVVFDDGRSQLQSADYSSMGISKLTVLQDGEEGRARSTWYLSENGDISQDPPGRRAAGAWDTITIQGTDDMVAKVRETFSQNQSGMKVEFWSTLDLSVLDDCRFRISGKVVRCSISSKRKSSTDKRYYYKAGSLATTATEKLRGVKK